MTPAEIAAAIGATVIVVCLLSVVVFFGLWAVAAALTIARARRRSRRLPPLLAGLARGCRVTDLVEIDDALERVLEQEHGRHPAGSTGRWHRGPRRRPPWIYGRPSPYRGT